MSVHFDNSFLCISIGEMTGATVSHFCRKKCRHVDYLKIVSLCQKVMIGVLRYFQTKLFCNSFNLQ